MEFETVYFIASIIFWEFIATLVAAWPFCFIFLFRKMVPLSCAVVAVLIGLIFLNRFVFKWDLNLLGNPAEDWFRYFLQACYYLGPLSLVLGFIEHTYWLTRANATGVPDQAQPAPAAITEGGDQKTSFDLQRAGYRVCMIVLCIIGVRVVPGFLQAQQIYALESDLNKALRKDPKNLQQVKDLLTRYGVQYRLEPNGDLFARMPTRNPFRLFEEEFFVHIQTKGNQVASFKIYYDYNAL